MKRKTKNSSNSNSNNSVKLTLNAERDSPCLGQPPVIAIPLIAFLGQLCQHFLYKRCYYYMSILKKLRARVIHWQSWALRTSKCLLFITGWCVVALHLPPLLDTPLPFLENPASLEIQVGFNKVTVRFWRFLWSSHVSLDMSTLFLRLSRSLSLSRKGWRRTPHTEQKTLAI